MKYWSHDYSYPAATHMHYIIKCVQKKYLYYVKRQKESSNLDIFNHRFQLLHVSQCYIKYYFKLVTLNPIIFRFLQVFHYFKLYFLIVIYLTVKKRYIFTNLYFVINSIRIWFILLLIDININISHIGRPTKQ